MPQRRYRQGVSFKKVFPRRQGMSQRVQPVRALPQRASNANPRRKH
jgi:hypothetical protein